MTRQALSHVRKGVVETMGDEGDWQQVTLRDRRLRSLETAWWDPRHPRPSPSHSWANAVQSYGVEILARRFNRVTDLPKVPFPSSWSMLQCVYLTPILFTYLFRYIYTKIVFSFLLRFVKPRVAWFSDFFFYYYFFFNGKATPWIRERKKRLRVRTPTKPGGGGRGWW